MPDEPSLDLTERHAIAAKREEWEVEYSIRFEDQE